MELSLPKSQKGQALVEYALIGILMLIAVGAIITLYNAYYNPASPYAVHAPEFSVVNSSKPESPEHLETRAEEITNSVAIQLESWDFESIKKSITATIPGIEDISCDNGFEVKFEGQVYHWDLPCPNDGDESGWRKLILTVIRTLLSGGRIQ